MRKIITSVTAIVVNEVSDEEVQKLVGESEVDSLQERLDDMEGDVEIALANRVFGDADDIAVLNVNTEVEE